MSGYAARSAPDGTGAEVALLTLGKEDAGSKDVPAEQRYVAFATSPPRRPADLPGGCRKRRGAETGHRGVKRVRPMTAGRSLSARIACFFFSLAMHNARMIRGAGRARTACATPGRSS